MFIKPINAVVAKVSGNLPLRIVLIVPFVLQIFAAVGLTGWLSLRNGQKAVNDVATQLRSEITAHIRSRLDAFIETPRLINQINEAAIRQRQVNPDDTKAMERYLFTQIQFFEYMTFISYGNNRGDYVTVNRRVDDRTIRLGIANLSTKNACHIYATDSQGNHTQLVQIIPNFDSRKRTWYQTAMQAGKPVWYPIYKYASIDSLGIGIANPVYDETGSLRGVLAADVALVQISKFLHSLKIGRTGQAFIMEPDGMLVASSNLEQPFIVQGKDTKRVRAIDSRDALIRGAATYLKERFNNLSTINNSQQLDFEIRGKRQFLQVLPYNDRLGLNLLIVVVVPEADFMEQIDASTRTTILLCIAALIVATVIGILTSKWVIKPILRLNTAAKEIAKGEWDKTLKEASNGTEAVKIWDSFEPHLIWMDMRMPVMDGYQATKRIKLTTKGQATAVIALTASVLEEERAVVLSACCDDFMRKPFQEAEIFELMNKHIGVRYVYDEPTAHTGSTVSKTDIQNTLNPGALAALPNKLLANLEHAASFAYMAEIDSYIDEIRSYNANLADALATLALDFEYGKIVTLIQQAKK